MARFESEADISQAVYLLERTDTIVSEKTRSIRLSYASTCGFFPLSLKLVHKLVHLHSEFIGSEGQPQIPKELLETSLQTAKSFRAKA
jgi:hypothetical protein